MFCLEKEFSEHDVGALLAASGQEDQQSGLAQLSGTWRLVYSSGFASGSYGKGQSPGLLPKLGQVTIQLQ